MSDKGAVIFSKPSMDVVTICNCDKFIIFLLDLFIITDPTIS